MPVRMPYQNTDSKTAVKKTSNVLNGLTCFLC